MVKKRGQQHISGETVGTVNQAAKEAPPPMAVPRWWAWAAAAGGAVAGGLAFNPLALRPLIVLAPLGCFLAVRWAATPRAAFARAWFFGFVYFFGVLHWLMTIGQWAPLEIMGFIGVAGLAAYLGLYPALAGLALRKWLWTPCATRQFALFAALWLLAEWVRTLGKLAMPLGQLGHAWATLPGAIQIAAWLGELGVSLQVLYLAGLIFLIGRGVWLRRMRNEAGRGDDPTNASGAQLRNAQCEMRNENARARKRLGWIIPALLLVALGWAAASLALARTWRQRTRLELAAPTARPLKVGLLQPNIPQDLKLASYGSPDENTRLRLQQQIRERTELMLAQHAPRGQYDLILLPETAYTEFDFYSNAPLRNRVSETVRQTGADMLVSASRVVNENEFYNTAYFVHADGAFDPHYYDKMRLVPFGENLPYFDWIPGVRSLIGIVPFTEGIKQTLFQTTKTPPAGGTPESVAPEPYKFGVLICFESTFSSLARDLAAAGADFLTVVTNDAWYGMSAGASNHHNLSLLRAVETRRWLLRCANTGITSIITPAGELAASLELGRQGFVQGTIAPGVWRGRTLYNRIGNGWLALAALGVALAAAARRREMIRHADGSQR